MNHLFRISPVFCRYFLVFAICCSLGAALGSPGNAIAQARLIGAHGLVLDDGSGHLITILPPTGLGGSYTYTLPLSPGGTITSGYVANGASNGQTLYWNGSYWTPSSYLFNTGTGVSLLGTLSANGGTGTSGQVLEINGAGNPVWATIGGTGTVTSVDVSGGSTGLSASGGPVTTSGTITLGGTLALTNGGTGATTQATAINNLLPSQTGNGGRFLQTNGSNVSWQTVSGSGTVTSIDVSGGTTGLTYSGGPVTTSGTITLAGTLGSANGGTGITSSGSSGNYLRSNGSVWASSAIQASDVPTLNQNTSGTAANVTGTVTIAHGGTGQITQQAAIDALTGSQSVGTYLRSDGSHATLSAIQAGDVPTLNQNTSGTASNVTGTVAITHGGTGQITQQAAIDALTGTQSVGTYLRSDGSHATLSAIQAGDVPTLNQNTTGTASNVTGTVAIANGGTGQTTANAALNALLPSQTGHSGDALVTNGSSTSWISVGGTGTVTSVDVAATGTGLTTSGGPVTGSGTITISGTLNETHGGTNQSGYTTGDILYASGPNTLSKLPIGSTNDVLTVSGGVPSWAPPGGGLTNPMNTLGDIIYEDATPTPARLAGNTSSARMFLSQTGNGTISAAPVWAALSSGDIPNNAANTSGTASNVTGTVTIAHGGTGQITQQAAIDALTGTQSAGTYLRSDGTHATLSGIQAADVPTLNQNTSGTASNVTGTITIAHGGTGQITQQAAIDALTGTQSAGTYLRSDGTHATLSGIQAADVPTLNQNTSGTASNVTGTVTIAHGGTGQITQQAAIDALTGTQSAGTYLRSDGNHATLSGILAADVPTLNQNTTGTASNVTGTVGVTNGGTGTTTQFTQGSVVFAGGSGVYSQDNSNFFWDATNHRLGIGNTGPGQALDVTGNANVSGSYYRAGHVILTESGVNGTFIGNTENTANSGNNNTYVGFDAGFGNTSGAQNTGVGEGALHGGTLTGSYNVAVGYDALTSLTDEVDNTAVGSFALQNDNHGLYNTAVGSYALQGVVNGVDNTALGLDAGQSNDPTGQTAIGYRSLLNTSGNYNVALGYNAGQTNSTGSNNTFLGSSADASVGTFTNATAIGAYAQVAQSNSIVLGSINGVNGASASTNVGIGTTTPSQALDINGSANLNGTYMINGVTFLSSAGADSKNNTIVGNTENTTNTANAQDNVYIGKDAGKFNTDGQFNVGIGSHTMTTHSVTGYLNVSVGYYSLRDIAGGQWNTALGAYALESVASAGNNTAVGYGAMDALTTGSYNVALGTAALSGAGSTNYNTALGANALESATNNDNTAVGYNAGTSLIGGHENTILGYTADVGASAVTNATAIGAYAMVSQSNSMVLGGITGTNGGTDTKVGIGTTSPAEKLEVKNGNVLLSNGGTAGMLELQGTSSGTSTFAAGAQGSTTINYTMPTSQPSANDVLTATSVSGSGPYSVSLGWAAGSSTPSFARRTTDTGYASTTPGNDNTLYLSLAANATYTFQAFLACSDSNASNITGKISMIDSAANYLRFGVNSAGGANPGPSVGDGSGTTVSNVYLENGTAGDQNFILVQGIVVTGSSSGNLHVRCGISSSGTGHFMRVYANSYLTATRVQ